MNSNDGNFASQIGKLMIMVVAIIVALWIAFKVVIPLVQCALPLIIIGFVLWFGYKLLTSESPKL